MANNVKDTKYTKHIARRVHLVRNGENFKMNKIGWREGGMQLADIETNNIGENELSPIITHIIVRLDNWYRTLVQ